MSASRTEPAGRPHFSALAKVWPMVLVFTLWATVVALAEYLGYLPGKISPVPFTFIGLPLGFFLAFRGNQGFARYWEARSHWAHIANCGSNIARQVDAFMRVAADEQPAELLALKRSISERLIGYVYALRADLAGDDVRAAALEHYPSMPERMLQAPSVPGAILRSLTSDLELALRSGWIDRIFARYIDTQVTGLNDAAGACKKIRDTPLPLSLVRLTERMVIVYAIGLPVGIVDMTGWFAPVVSAVIVFAFLGLNVIAGELAEPFTPGPNELPMLEVCRQAELELRAYLAPAASHTAAAATSRAAAAAASSVDAAPVQSQGTAGSARS